jgi:hypothetical protein
MALALNAYKTIIKVATTSPVGIYTAPTGYSGIVLLAQIANVGSQTYTVTVSHERSVAGTAVTTNFAQVTTGLLPSTQYYVFVRAICSTTVTSPWAGPITFTTSCAPITILPHLEPFNTVLPSVCWLRGDNGNLTTGPATFGANSWFEDGLGNNGTTGAVKYNIFVAAANDWIISPQFTIPATGWELKFDAAAANYGATTAVTNWEADDFVEVLVSSSTSGLTNWTVLYTYNNTNVPAPAGVPNVIDLDAYAGQTVRFAYRAVEGTANGSADIDFTFDNFELKVSPNIIPSCATGLTSVPNATCGNFANQLSWSATQDASGYYVTIGTTSGGTDIANAVSVSATNYSFTGNVNTQYFWKVVPFSGAGSATGCTIQSFTTVATGCYCPSVPTSNDGTGITNATIGTSPFVIADVMYANNTATAVAVEPGTNTNVQLVFATGLTYDINIWIDFNNDFDFNDAGELVKTGIACTNVNPNTVDASFLMPLTAPTGPHRMRIGTADSGQVPPAPCYSGTYGVTLDFTVDTTLGSNTFDTSNFVAYPNPVKDVLNLTYKTAISNVKVINLLGQEVVNSKVNTNDVQVNMSALNAGVYIVNVTVDDKIHSIKVIKE